MVAGKKTENIMKTYKHKPLIVKAIQWYRNGDHPLDYKEDIFSDITGERITREYQKENDWEGQVIRRYRSPYVPGETLCPDCRVEMRFHGWIDDNSVMEPIVCPGDYVISNDEGKHYPCSPSAFEELYDLVDEEPETKI